MTDNRHLEPSDFEGAQLEQMRKWVHGGSGAEGLYEQSENWNSEDQYLRELKTRLEGKLQSVGAFMQSDSGEAMKDQATPVVLWTEITADSAKLQSEQMTAQGEAFKKVQTSIPAKGEEQDVPDDMWIEESWDTLTTGSTDAEDAKAHNEKLRQDAVQAFSTYQDSTQSNVSGSAQFEAPPAVAQPDGGVSSNPGPSVGGAPSSTSSAWADGAGAGSGGSAGGAGGSGGSGGSLGSGGSAGTGSAWANTPGGGGNQNPGGTGRVPGGPGTPGTPGGGLGVGGPGAGAGRGGAGGAGGGRGGAGAGAGGRGGSGVGAGGRAGAGGPGMGAGGRSGMGGLGGASGAGGAGAGGAGGRGGAGAGAGAGARGKGQGGEDDLEHETPDYLVGDQGVFDEDLPRVAPPVFGDWDNQR